MDTDSRIMPKTVAAEKAQRIETLPPLIANQIAAGEVVTRPVAVVKELVENSLDADARSIDIQIVNGGIASIIIADDGIGIPKDQLGKALQRHATSKVRTAEDLTAIQTLGFRGEALAAITAVAKVRLASHPRTQSNAYQIEVNGYDDAPEVSPCALPNGTRIEVKDLFFNTPGRRAFLKSPRTEWLHIEQVLKGFMLMRPDVGFMVTVNGKRLYTLKPEVDAGHASQVRRLNQLYDKQFTQQAIAFQADADGLVVNGWLGLPKSARTDNKHQLLFVNHRLVRDKVLHHAIMQFYQNHLVLSGHQYPSYALWLTIPAQEVDVNVHPAKTEIRLTRGQWVHDFIYKVLTQALAAHTQASSTNSTASEAPDAEGKSSEPSVLQSVLALARRPEATRKGLSRADRAALAELHKAKPQSFEKTKSLAEPLSTDAQVKAPQPTTDSFFPAPTKSTNRTQEAPTLFPQQSTQGKALGGAHLSTSVITAMATPLQARTPQQLMVPMADKVHVLDMEAEGKQWWGHIAPQLTKAPWVQPLLVPLTLSDSPPQILGAQAQWIGPGIVIQKQGGGAVVTHLAPWFDLNQEALTLLGTNSDYVTVLYPCLTKEWYHLIPLAYWQHSLLTIPKALAPQLKTLEI